MQDQFLLSWLQSSLSASLLPIVIGCRHTWQLWDQIHQNFHSKVEAQARQLRTELRTLKKGTNTITEFLNKIKAISDSLMSIDEIVTTTEQLDVILEGLPLGYESLVTFVNSKVDWFDLDEIKALLLAYEQCVNKQKIVEEVASLNVTQVASSSDQNVTPQANYTTSTQLNDNSKSTNANSGRNFYGGRGGRGSGHFGRGRGRGFGCENIQCQVCYSYGHDASICYHHFISQYAPQGQYPIALAYGKYGNSYGDPYQYVRPTTTTNYIANATSQPQQPVV